MMNNSHTLNLEKPFKSASLYQVRKENDLPYFLGFSAFIFALVAGALLTLLLWEQAVRKSGFNLYESYLFLPTQFFLALVLVLILIMSVLMVKSSYTLMLEQNRQTLQLLKLLGAEDTYIINSFYRSISKACMKGICLGTLSGFILLGGFRFYLLFLFAEINSLPKINAIDSWLLSIGVVTIPIYWLIFMLCHGSVIRKFLK